MLVVAEVIFLKSVCCLEKERVKFEKVICPTIWRAHKIVDNVYTVEAVNREYNKYKGNIYKDVLYYVQWRINIILARKTPFISPIVSTELPINHRAPTQLKRQMAPIVEL